MSMSEEEPQPPPSPDIHRKIRLHRWQWIGVPILLVIPLIAILGVFGESRATAQARTSDLAVEIQYPTRNRYRMLNNIRLDVTNTSDGILDTVRVDVDTAYASRFSTVVAIPTFKYPYTIELIGLEPGQTRRVRVELQGEQYGRHSGELRISSGESDTARIPIRTFIFP